MRPDVTRWLRRRTWQGSDWPSGLLLELRENTTVSVVIPALDEEGTIGDIVTRIVEDLVVAPAQLVDEVVVMDSGSTDRTAQVAAAAGARVVHRDDVLPEVMALPGKGEVLWRSLLATSGDLVVFVDGDLEDFSSSVVAGLLGPLLVDPGIELVKGCYERPLRDGDRVLATGGGRVTELVARPLLNLHWPELSGLVQPLVGEYAARRDLLEALPFPTGYGVELALLVDTLELLGLDAIAQVDLGIRHHRHQDEQALGRMAAEIWQTALARLDEGRIRPRGASLTQFSRSDGEIQPVTYDLTVVERPPMVEVRAELARRAS